MTPIAERARSRGHSRCRLPPTSVLAVDEVALGRVSGNDPLMSHDGPDEETRLLAPVSENLAAIKVFPLIPSLKKDVVVSIGVHSAHGPYSPLGWR